MTRTAAFTAELVRAASRGLAGIAAARFFERAEGADERYGEGGFDSWREAIGARLDSLASALDADDPTIFADDLLWFRGMTSSRDVAGDELELALDSIEAVLTEELPEGTAEAIRPFFQAGRQAFASEGAILEGLAPGSAAAELFDVALVGDLARARRYLVDGLRSDRFTLEQAILEVLLPAAREAGRRWHVGELGVAAEHVVTSTLRSSLHSLTATLPPVEPNGKAAFIAAVPGDAHDTGLVAFALLLERDGWRVALAGADTPTAEVDPTAEAYGCDLIALSATLAAQRHALTRYLADRGGSLPVLVGGAAIHGSEDALSLGAHGYAGNLAEGVAEARRLVGLAG